MPTVCIQCAMESILSGTRVEAVEQTPEEHMRLVHPDPVACIARRRELERLLAEKMNLRPPMLRSTKIAESE